MSRLLSARAVGEDAPVGGAMVRCTCDGTGWIRFRGKIHTLGDVYDDVVQTRRCAGYLDYFDRLPRGRSLGNLKLPKNRDGVCEAAVKYHREAIERAQRARDGFEKDEKAL